MSAETGTARILSEIFSCADWTPQGMENVLLSALGTTTRRKWHGRLIADILENAPTPYAPSPHTLTRLILQSRAFRGLRLNDRERSLFQRFSFPAPEFSPIPAFRNLDIPELASPADVATWLGLPLRHVEWFADVEGYRVSANAESTRHYFNKWIAKRAGPPRLIEAPKPMLKSVQRKILHDILDAVPPHDCAHAFRRGRSCITAAQRHAGEDIVVTVDLKDFFPSVPIRNVHGMFRCLGYPWAVARILAGLCTTATPALVFDEQQAGGRHDALTRRLLRQQHLPQGAPTSPALANLSVRRLDCRLDGLARTVDARYTRYGDDLAFSGDREFARKAAGFVHAVSAICVSEGFPLNRRKTKIMRQGGRQRLTGIVVNDHINVLRPDYDRLKATLFNCVHNGPATQNREGHRDFRAHLDGRITWVENVNPRRGHKLRQLFRRIEWP